MMKLLSLALFAIMIGSSIAAPSFFAPYGPSNGDSTLHRNDDESTSTVSLIGGMNFFGSIRSTVYVNNNGLITLDASTGVYTPSGLNTVGQPTIAAFWADIDTRPSNGGYVYYRSTVSPSVVAPLSQFVRDTNPGSTFVGTKCFIVTWDQVGYYNQKVNKLNTFQLALVADNIDTYAIMNYGAIDWTTGDASGGSNGLGGVLARVGFAKGNGEAAELPISGTSNVINVEEGTNAYINGVPQIGQYIFTVSSTVVISACCSTANGPVINGAPTGDDLNINIASINDVPTDTYTVTATSECTSPTTSPTTFEEFKVFGCPVERTWAKTDACGRSNSVTQYFHYPEEFSEELTITLPAAATVQISSSGCTFTALPSASVTGTATHNRGAFATVTISDSTFTDVNGVCTLNRFFIVNDICREQVVGQQIITATTQRYPPDISVAEYCAQRPIAEGDSDLFCAPDGTHYYSCMTGEYNSQSAVMPCPGGLVCKCPLGSACETPCDWPSK